MIEDNERDTIDFDPNRTNSLPVVRSIMRHFLGNYDIIPEEECQAVIDRLAIVRNCKCSQLGDPTQRKDDGFHIEDSLGSQIGYYHQKKDRGELLDEWY